MDLISIVFIICVVAVVFIAGKKKQGKKRPPPPLFVDETGQHSCLFCGKRLKRVREHWLTVHKKISAIKDLAKLKPKAATSDTDSENERVADVGNAEEYKKTSAKLIRKGDAKGNAESIARGFGPVVVVRNTDGEKDGSKYRPCPFCKGFFLKR